MIEIKAGTKKAEAMVWEWKHCYKGDSVEEAYGHCSSRKKASFNEIWWRCKNTEGYNHDLKITSATCYFYSTMYTFTTSEGTFLVKDTHTDTYITKIA